MKTKKICEFAQSRKVLGAKLKYYLANTGNLTVISKKSGVTRQVIWQIANVPSAYRHTMRAFDRLAEVVAAGGE